MTRHGRELLQKQPWGVNSTFAHNGIIILMIVAAVLVGMGIGDILTKHYAALISYPNWQN